MSLWEEVSLEWEVGHGVVQRFSNSDIGLSPGVVVKAWVVPPEFLILLVWGTAWECVFPTCFQEMLLLLVWDHTLRTSGVVEWDRGCCVVNFSSWCCRQ